MSLRFVRSPWLLLVPLMMPLNPAGAQSRPASLPVEGDDDNEGNKLKASGHDVHALHRLPGSDFRTLQRVEDIPADAKLVVRTHAPVTTPFPFNDLVPSWNIDAPPGGFVVELRLGPAGTQDWTPWYYLGSWGEKLEPPAKHTKDDHGFINIDYFQSRNRFDRFQFRVLLTRGTGRTIPAIRHVTAAYSNTLGDAELAREFRKVVDPGPKEKWARRLPVPFRSQKWEDERVRGSICSPTSTSMVLEYRGRKYPTAEVYQRIWDPEYRLYGNWWRAVQGAYTFGTPGYIQRFGSWDEVKRKISDGQPIIASIKVRRGQLRNAPYRQSNGHLIVIAGMDEEGNVLVNDPAAETAEAGQTTYHRDDMQAVWLDNGGIGYILEPPARQ